MEALEGKEGHPSARGKVDNIMRWFKKCRMVTTEAKEMTRLGLKLTRQRNWAIRELEIAKFQKTYLIDVLIKTSDFECSSLLVIV